MVVLVAGDSRIRDFPYIDCPVSDLFDFIVHPCLGAGLLSIGSAVENTIRDIAHEKLVLVLILGGICDITRKFHHSGGVEVIPRKVTFVAHHARSVRDQLRSAHPNLLISFATIIMIDLEKSKKYYESTKALWNPINSEDDNRALQKQLSEKVGAINGEISMINADPQPLLDFHDIKVPQAFIHHFVEKVITI